MYDATKAEAAWMKKVERLLMNPPSARIGIYTVGDCGMTVYDKTKDDQIHQIMDSRNADFCCAVEDTDARIGDIRTAMNIHSTAGQLPNT